MCPEEGKEDKRQSRADSGNSDTLLDLFLGNFRKTEIWTKTIYSQGGASRPQGEEFGLHAVTARMLSTGRIGVLVQHVLSARVSKSQYMGPLAFDMCNQRGKVGEKRITACMQQ